MTELNRNLRRLRRRRFIAVSIAAVFGYFGYSWWRSRPKVLVRRETRYVTPIENFYSVSIQPGFEPEVDESSWRLDFELEGRVVFQIDLQGLRALERRSLYKTFMCVSNPVGGGAIGNALWTAAPLAPLIERVLESGTVRNDPWVTFFGLDGFDSSIPLAVALDPESYIAYEMNGRELPVKFGYPARVLLPGKYGMKQPRWLHRISVGRGGRGYWEQRGWSNHAEVRTTSRIDAVALQDEGVWKVTGIAYCGRLPVGRVQFSSDGGDSWSEAALTSSAEPNAWATWEAEWRPESVGEHVLATRAVDASGGEQSSRFGGSFPSGSTGYHRVVVTVGTAG